MRQSFPCRQTLVRGCEIDCLLLNSARAEGRRITNVRIVVLNLSILHLTSVHRGWVVCFPPPPVTFGAGIRGCGRGPRPRGTHDEDKDFSSARTSRPKKQAPRRTRKGQVQAAGPRISQLIMRTGGQCNVRDSRAKLCNCYLCLAAMSAQARCRRSVSRNPGGYMRAEPILASASCLVSVKVPI